MAVMDMVMGVITYPCCNVVVGLGVACLGAALYLINRYAAGGVCRSKALLNGKTVVITGGNTGIGLEAAVDLAKRNARVILACRSVERGEKAAVEVRKRSKSDNVVFVQLDLASLDSVRRFADTVLQREPRIDVLVNNAGIMALPQRKETKEGFEMQFGVNHLGHFLLTNLLLDRIKEAPAGRIVNVSSLGHRRGKMDFDDLNSVRSYSAFGAYGRSKLANVLFTRSLAKRLALEGTNTTANSLHPGGVRTELGRNLSIYLSAYQGAQTSIHCAVCEEMEGVSGKYLADCKVTKTLNPQATDDEIAERLWKVSAEMVGL